VYLAFNDNQTLQAQLSQLSQLSQLYRLYLVLLVSSRKPVIEHQHSSAFIGVHRGCTQGWASPAPTVHDFALQHSSG